MNNIYTNSNFLKRAFFTLCLFISVTSFSQVVGDYRSVSSANWTTLSTWQVYNGSAWVTPSVVQGYPGQFAGTNDVAISHTVTIGTGGITTQLMGRITISPAGVLYLTGSISTITFTLNSPEVIVNAGGSIYLFNKVKLQLPTDAVLFVTTNGLVTDGCNNNKEIWIGIQKYAACAGAPGNIYTFDQLMALTAGGTLNAISTNNGPLCFNQTLNLTGSYSGAIGTAVSYSWRVISPLNDTTYFSTQNASIPNVILGTYNTRLTVLTVLNGLTYTNSETKLVVVNPLPTLTNATLQTAACDGSSAIIGLTGLVINTTFTVDYNINGVVQTPVTGIVSNATGVASFNTTNLTLGNNGQILKITGITITSWVNSCTQTFNNDVTLGVISSGSWIGTTSTDWNTASNWCGGIPTATSIVVIPSTAPNQPIIGVAGGVCRNITINSGASLTISSTNLLSVNGDWINNGNFVSNSSTVIFNGTSTITGTAINTFNNVTISNTFSLTAPNANVNIKGDFTNNGTFNHNNGTLTFNGTTAQLINSGGSSFNNLTISNTTNSCTASNNPITVLGSFTTNVGSILDMSTYALTVNTVSHSGTLLTQNTSAAPFTAAKVWGGLVTFNSTSATQNMVSGTFNNLTLKSTFGVISSFDITVNGILDLAINNPSATKGLLDMGAGASMKILYMGPSATTIGLGDVSGKIKRTSLIENKVYTFGSQYTTITFTNGSGVQLPDELLFIVKIGTTHPIKTSAINRYYEIVRSGSNPGSNPTRFNLTLKYLNSELNGNNETNIVFWDHHIPYAALSPHEHGQSAQDLSQHFITLASHSINYLVKNEYSQTGEITYIDDTQTPPSQSKIWMLSERISPSGDSVFVWLGTDPDFPTDWTKNNNWVDNKSPTNAIIEGIPGSKHYVYIPETPNKPILPTNDTTRVKYIYIYQNGQLNARANKLFQADYVRIYEGGIFNAENAKIEILGSLNIDNGNVPWNNLGNFIAGTSIVKFFNADAAISGSTDFYDVTINTGAKLSMITNCTMRIANNIVNNGIWNTTFYGQTTVGYNGTIAQTVILPDENKYHHLELSGSNVKTLPNTELTMLGNFSISGTASTTPTYPLLIIGNFALNTGATFTASSLVHKVGENWINSGTFIATGSTIEFNGINSGSIGESNFNNITFVGAGTKTAIGSLSIVGDVIVGNNFTGGNYTHTVSGNWTNSGTFVSTGSTIDFNGTNSANIGESNFNNITFSGSGTKTATGILSIAADVNISNNFTAGNFTHTVGGNWTKSGTFNANNSTINFDGANTGNIGSSNFNHIQFSGAGVKTAIGALSIAGDLTITNNFTAGNFTHTVDQNWTNSGTFNATSSTINFTNTTTSAIGTSNFNEIIFSGVGTKTATGVLSIAGSVLILNNFTAGNFIHTVGKNWTNSGVFTATNSTIDFNSSSAGNIGSSNFNNITFSGAGTKTALGVLTIAGNVNITDNFTAGNFTHPVAGNWANSGIFTTNNSSIDFVGNSAATIGSSNFNHIVFSGAGTKTATGTLSIAGNVDINNNFTAGNFTHFVAQNWNKIGIFSPSQSTINFNGITAGNISASNFNNITFSGSGTKNANGILTITGDVLISDNFHAGNYSHQMGGNYTNLGTFFNDLGTIIFNGITSQYIISGGSKFYNVIFNNTGGNNDNFNLTDSMTISNSSLFTQGILVISGPALLTYEQNATSNSGNSSSFVDGYVRKIGDTTFTFPIGGNNLHAPLTISDADGVSVSTDWFTARYISENPLTTYSSFQLPIQVLSRAEYWTLDRVGTNNVFVTLSWDVRSGGVSNMSTLLVAHWDGAKWVSKGQTAVTGNNNAGTITSELNTNFSPFTLASSNSDNALPVSLISFEGKCIGSGDVELKWATASELNNAYFMIQRSYDSQNWVAVGTVNGSGNSNNVVKYSYIDNYREMENSPDIVYYRLKQVDFDGTTTIYNIINVSGCKNSSLSTSGFNVFPNPFKDDIKITHNSKNVASIDISISEINNKLVKEYIFTGSEIRNIITLNLSFLPSGVYMLRFNNGSKEESVKIVKAQ